MYFLQYIFASVKKKFQIQKLIQYKGTQCNSHHVHGIKLHYYLTKSKWDSRPNKLIDMKYGYAVTDHTLKTNVLITYKIW